jgi:NTP pyrophosphatase (non-canonical NTP hydrolase)
VEEAVHIATVQRLAWENKVAKDFNTTDVALEFGLLTAEVGEAFTAWRKRLPDVGEELADVLIYVTCLAEMTGVALDAEVERKLAKNATRQYCRDARGVLLRVAGPAASGQEPDGQPGGSAIGSPSDPNPNSASAAKSS